MKEGFQGDIAIDDISFVNCDIGKKTIIWIDLLNFILQLVEAM